MLDAKGFPFGESSGERLRYLQSPTLVVHTAIMATTGAVRNTADGLGPVSLLLHPLDPVAKWPRWRPDHMRSCGIRCSVDEVEYALQ